eukprot:jgi/Botrbrau1/10063/Bobra.0355s0019.2
MGKRKAAAVSAEQADDGRATKEARLVDGEQSEEPQFRNKEKVLLLSSRGITHRFRHLMLDLVQLLPHCKKDAKLDTKSDRGVINEVAEIKGCSSVVFFEARKHKDLYLWISKSPSGPSVKFHVLNVHTMAELKLSGNHLKGSRPVLSFHSAFDEQPPPASDEGDADAHFCNPSPPSQEQALCRPRDFIHCRRRLHLDSQLSGGASI